MGRHFIVVNGQWRNWVGETDPRRATENRAGIWGYNLRFYGSKKVHWFKADDVRLTDSPMTSPAFDKGKGHTLGRAPTGNPPGNVKP
ncbi:hypothetical protein EXIGLDRAFT_725577 [Exidia glandulosa HHB12029]|uniref:Uncharacterized protein n=1 Tax=Exidia glandulosa HHB12029 TaxID=1314781 RepID=A0A165DYC9_EXIGL|nr:hypothetical protein EXIGLDRAFT_725577 [Exidia glandulosa HHB12029]